MSLGLNIRTNDHAVVDEIRRLRRIGARVEVPLRQIGQRVVTHARRRLGNRRSEFGSSSGRLARSLTVEVHDDFVRAGSPMVYARIQQVGGKIKPKGRYLAIPATSALRRRGVWPRDLPRASMKFVPAARITIGNRSWIGPALVRAQSTAEEVSLSGGQGRDARGRYASKAADVRLAIGEVMFALVKAVTIQGRPYLLFESQEQQFALRALRSYYQKQLAARRGGG